MGQPKTPDKGQKSDVDLRKFYEEAKRDQAQREKDKAATPPQNPKK